MLKRIWKRTLNCCKTKEGLICEKEVEKWSFDMRDKRTEAYFITIK